jgi:3-oxoacyl-[acyl-carrier-protein] synthase III
MSDRPEYSPEESGSFFERPEVKKHEIPVGRGVPLGIASVSHPEVGIGGAYGTWGESYDNKTLPELIEDRLGMSMSEEDQMDLAQLGFVSRHHLWDLSDEEQLDVEVEVGTRFLQEAAKACGWKPEEVDAVMIGMSGPVSEDYTERIARQAGVPDEALKVSVHKACDSSMGALQLALNPDLPVNRQSIKNLAEELRGKKVLVGGIEGLSRFMGWSKDLNALQLFGNGAGVIGVIPGKTMNFLLGKAHELFDEQGVLAVRMYYPHSRRKSEGESLVEVSEAGENHLRFAGLMHEPEGGVPVEMAGPMGMVKLFVRAGVDVVRDVYQAYQSLTDEYGAPKEIAVAIVHHANYKINQLKAKHLQREGISLPMPWLLSEFGNVSAASNMIAFLRELPNLKPGDHIMFDGFGAGTYYDVFTVAMGPEPGI